ncbi:MAG: hypothetical protein QE267_03060 [Akkermansiaceae bacterium]|nr:hypothetical protein [Akkermansiaceae bacterium]
MNLLSLIQCFALVSLAAAPLVQAQAQASSLQFSQKNALYHPLNQAGGGNGTAYGPPGSASIPITNNGTLGATPGSNNRGLGQSSGSTAAGRTDADAPTYPNNDAEGTDLLSLRRSTFGTVFGSGLPLYRMGDEITPPLTKLDGTVASAGYWRRKPVQPDESFLTAQDTQTKPIPLGSVTVTSSSTGTRVVTVASVPSTLVKGASLLGQPVINITGTTVTLAGNADSDITGSVVCPITPALSYYYSPHAEKSFASQPGQVTVNWVSNEPNGSGYFTIMPESFLVSGSPAKPVRKIFWNTNNNDGPAVNINNPAIMDVTVVYNPQVPKAVVNESVAPGTSESLTPNYNTLKFNNVSSLTNLTASNVQGRVLVEYLGNYRGGEEGTRHHIGFDIVEIVRSADIAYLSTPLGKEILPRDGSLNLTAVPLATASAYYSSVTLGDGSTTYYAERTTSAANEPENGTPVSTTAYSHVVFNWLETGEYGIKWPKYKDAYWLRWSPNVLDYTHQTVDAIGSTAATGLKFGSGSMPTIVFQDDPDQTEATLDVQSQALLVNPGADARNRSLLKFTAAGIPWYVNLYTQAENRITSAKDTFFSTSNNVITATVDSTAGLEIGTMVSGDGYSGTIKSILNETQYTLNDDAVLPKIPNPSFEEYALDNYWYQDPESSQNIPGWTFTSKRGVQPSNGWSFMIDTTVQHGRLALFMQTNQATATTTVTGLKAGISYQIQFSVARRNYHTSLQLPYTVSVDGLTKHSETLSYSTTSATFSTRNTSSFTATGPTATLRITLNPSGDASLLLDNFQIRPTSPATYSVESDRTAHIPQTTAATVGDRIAPPAGHELGGYISGGRCYYPNGYVNPFTAGMDASNRGAIIPVNAKTGDNTLTVRWFKKVPAPSAQFSDFYVAGKIGRYTVSYPSNPSEIVIAQGIGTGDLTGAKASGSVYYQNDSNQIGYNPNEEHAFMLGGRAYALRDDLNVTTADSNYTSQPYVLVSYTNSSDQRPAMHAYKVLRTNATYNFNYNATAGTLLVKPYPLPLLPEPLVENTAVTADPPMVSKDLEIDGADLPTNANSTVRADGAYKKFTFEDRKAFNWVHRGPHDAAKELDTTPNGTANVTLTNTAGLTAGMVVTGNGITGTVTIVSVTNPTSLLLSDTVATGAARPFTYRPAFTMKLYYKSREGFFIPGMPTQPNAGTILPFLRRATRSGESLDTGNIDSGHADEPLSIVYIPAWPTSVPELAVGETLTLAKYGLPQVRGQKSAQVYYQQSIAKDTANSPSDKASVVLHDPTRVKTYPLKVGGLTSLPTSILTTSYRGKTYFQGLSPSLQQRFYFDPIMGPKGTLVFKGEFHDAIAGEDYLDLNVLTVAEVTKLKSLVPSGNDKTNWDAAIAGLSTTVETFTKSDASVIYAVKPDLDDNVNATELATISNSDTAVDSYAVTALGKGTGYVTMVFGDGKNPDRTPQGDPVQVKVFKVANRLYTGDLKVVNSSNPLDEQVSLRHSGDFAAKPEDYDFEWRWTTGAASAPAVYRTELGTNLGATANWQMYTDPGTNLPTVEQYGNICSNRTVTVPRTVLIRPSEQFIGTYEPTSVDGKVVNMANTSSIEPGMVVSGDSLDSSNTTTVEKVKSNTQIELSHAPAGNSTSTLSFVTPTYTDADAAAGFPSVVFKAVGGVDFTSGVPGKIVFSANVGNYDGLVLYVNDTPALAYNAPTTGLPQSNANTGLSPRGLTKQFNVAPNYFAAKVNTIQVALYTTSGLNASSSVNFMLEAATETDLVTTADTVWQSPSDPNGVLSNTAIVGGHVSNPFGGPQFVLNDRWFTVRYRPKAGTGNVLGSTNYSRWMPAQLNEGWVKRVLAAINPFSQRVTDLYNNATDTDVSMLTQAGKRWEGDIALTLSNVNDVGLIEIYETVLNRAKSMSIDASTNDPDTNNALILAAGYLNDLYMILGNEAFADAANPTISLDDAAVTTSRFTFEGQVGSSLDEELTLLRGRDNSVSPGVQTAPAYNRLYWNYTRGINGGEAIYATNYNITEVLGSSTANGVIDESDAQLMFPQGHGDAYGHFLTALKGYYRLLHNPNFTWTPRAEAVTVMGQAVTIDYQDERKFAASAVSLARTAQQICELLFRKNYKDDLSSGWNHFAPANPHESLDHAVSRGTQGALFNWVMANALLPAVDDTHTGIQKIDRTTVPELDELKTLADGIQTTVDNADARLNPLGLSPGAIAFDISPNALRNGTSHYEQIYDRALGALNNAAGAMKQAGRMTASLRDQQNTVDDYVADISNQEVAYVSELIEIFGKPYEKDVGPGRLYAQSYSGPDLINWFVVDRPLGDHDDVINTYSSSKTYQVDVDRNIGHNDFTGDSITDIVNHSNDSLQVAIQEVTVNPNRFIQYSDNYYSEGMGTRPETGELQSALMAAHLAQVELLGSMNAFTISNKDFQRKAEVFGETISNHASQLSFRKDEESDMKMRMGVVAAMETMVEASKNTLDHMEEFTSGQITALPTEVGTSNDISASARFSLWTIKYLSQFGFKAGILTYSAAARKTKLLIDKNKLELDTASREQEYSLEATQLAYQLEQAYNQLSIMQTSIQANAAKYELANQKVSSVLGRGLRVLTERETFRTRAAAVIQGYRTNDLTFRVFRDESLQQYRSLFDLASRYTYLAAKSYDYETGLLGTSNGQEVFNRIVASRSLGDLTGGRPQATVSDLGDSGLAGTLAKLNADFSVAKGNLGINNPDLEGTLFSLRPELFRLKEHNKNGTTLTSDEAWRQTLESYIVPDIVSDSDVVTFCQGLARVAGTKMPGIIIPFQTVIHRNLNFFGLPKAPGDHSFHPSRFATKIAAVGMVFPGYIGMLPADDVGGTAITDHDDSLGASPYVYLIPCGNDSMWAPTADGSIRSWKVQDQAIPLPYNLGGTQLSSGGFFSATGSLTEQPWTTRKHGAFLAIEDSRPYVGRIPWEYSSARLVGRSVWNSRWKIVIPASSLGKEQDADANLTKFANSVDDIELFFRTYSHSGNQ